MALSRIKIYREGRKTRTRSHMTADHLKSMIRMLQIPRSDNPNSACTHLIPCEELSRRLTAAEARLEEQDRAAFLDLSKICSKALEKEGSRSVAHIYLET